MDTPKSLFLSAPAGTVDGSLRASIKLWSDDPTALQVLHTLDAAVDNCPSSFVSASLEAFLAIALAQENKTYEQVVSEATWRK